MFVYEKKLQYPVRIQNPNPKLAAIIISQYGGPDGELGASLRYLSQRFSMPYPELKGLLTDIGTEETAPRPWKFRQRFQSRKGRSTVCAAGKVSGFFTVRVACPPRPAPWKGSRREY